MTTDHATERGRRLARATLDAVEGEEVIPHYSHAAAACDCPALGEYSSVPFLVVARSAIERGRGGVVIGGVDRCLTCGKRWKAKAYDHEPDVEVAA